MRYGLLIGEEARDQLRALTKALRRNIGQRLGALQDGLSGDVKKLTAREHKYRRRAGSYRVLFQRSMAAQIILYQGTASASEGVRRCEKFGWRRP
jgi:mRNA-degrading endonuclease RelE of RelBE toxin-antitoxin system